jgi:hypothetical protein
VSAHFSRCRTWRYWLSRYVGPGEAGTHSLERRRVAFIGLNPSTADETQDDPTIRRCIRFAHDWGFSFLDMLNLYAWRSTDPLAMFIAAKDADIVGPENDKVIADVCRRADLVIVAWGARGDGRADAVLDIVGAAHCLGYTQDGLPRHPLYIRADTRPQPYKRNGVNA